MKSMKLIEYFSRTVARSLPPPAFLRMAATGIEISNQSIRFLRFRPTQQGLKIADYGEERVPEGTGYAEELHLNEDLKKILRRIQRSHKLELINVALPEDKAYLFQLSLPKLPETEIRGAIELQLEENVPFAAKEVLFDYLILNRESEENTSGYIDLGVAVFPRAIIESFIQLFESVGLRPLSFEIGAQAIANAVIPRGDITTQMIVNLGERKTGIYIVSRGVALFTSTLNFGGEALTTVIQKHFSVSREEAVRIKRAGGSPDSKETMPLLFALMSPISALKEEVNRLYQYWHSHRAHNGEASPQIGRLVLCGGDSSLRGLNEYLAQGIGVETVVANVWRNAFSFDLYIPPLTLADSLNFAAPVGLALESKL